MYVGARKTALAGLMLALTVVCICLGSVIESNTLFLLAAASYFVGIVVREMGLRMGAAFYLAGILLGALLSPNKLYVVSYAAMGLYILAVECIWRRVPSLGEDRRGRRRFWLVKYLLFNLMFLPACLLAPRLFFAGEAPRPVTVAMIAAGQVVLALYDRAYEYVQGVLWNRMRKRLLG